MDLWRVGAWLLVVVWWNSGAVRGAEPEVSQLKSDEQIVFQATYGHVDPAGGWRLNAAGVVFESRNGVGVAAQLAEFFGLPADAGESELFRKRIAHFLVDHERGKRIVARIGTLTHAFEPTDDDGVFAAQLHVEDLAAIGISPEIELVSIAAILREGDLRKFAGAIRLIGPRGWSVVCDIDDTIKVTEVHDRRALMANTFLRPFRPVEGMPAALRAWSERGAAFHYVSASPTQLGPLLAEFIDEAGLPAGTLHLRKFRLMGDHMLKVDQGHDEFKHGTIGQILRDFPGRSFILVGDSSQRDPEIYGRLAREFARQVAHIFIRDVTGEGADSPRFATAFEGVPATVWHIFTDAAEVRAELTRR